ncbi:hypothetical protein Barb6XT_00074 [Bacteroidales bacterium Barb6XT]|nr:hypothetical protein Barb6XT_00932 [Bacteroidales bacterium Barb6XT]OAV68694.1 hypothetical protein Barb6XT_00869 [Bacteroidales bacterium Barb6XT]OAV70038.1 hypothetical protein Barb6XT_00074 [Bacteroidales bacterium Barb6XT]
MDKRVRCNDCAHATKINVQTSNIAYCTHAAKLRDDERARLTCAAHASGKVCGYFIEKRY